MSTAAKKPLFETSSDARAEHPRGPRPVPSPVGSHGEAQETAEEQANEEEIVADPEGARRHLYTPGTSEP